MRSSGSRQLATGSQRWSAVAETVGIWSHLNRQAADLRAAAPLFALARTTPPIPRG